MTVNSTSIDGVLVIEPKVFYDERGHFLETFNARDFLQATGVEAVFVQDNESKSNEGTLRGLHFQVPPYDQGKLVRVSQGAVLDVVVDVRKGSPTFGRHLSVLLSAKNQLQLWVPSGFAHGFLAIEDHSVVNYKCTAHYHHEAERCLHWNDQDLGIDWGIDAPLVSEKDAAGTFFADIDTPFEFE